MNNDLKINIVGEDIYYLFFLVHKKGFKVQVLKNNIYNKSQKNYYFFI